MTTEEDDLLGPLVLKPVLQERVWGAKSLAPWYQHTPESKLIGEAWLTALECRVENGALPGQTLEQVLSAHPAAVGREYPLGEFPLLIKLLFPREKLSVQVHPNDEQARAMGLPRGKTECWYVLSAEPGATVAVGFREPLSQEAMRAAIADGSLEEKLAHLPVKAGDMVYVDAGTVHAIGPGVVLLETQQYSDVTYRLFDHGRPRELHLEKGFAVARAQTQAGIVPPMDKGAHTQLVQSPYFTVDRFSLAKDQAVDLDGEDELQVVVALEDGCSLESAAGKVAMPKAHAVVLPSEGVDYKVVASRAADIIRIMP